MFDETTNIRVKVDPKILAKNRSKDKKKMEQMMWEGAKDMGLETVLSDRGW